MGEEIITEPLAPDSSRSVTLSFLLPSFSFASLADVYQWVAKVDAGQVLEETEENNNIRSGNAVVFPIILVPNDSLQMGSVLLNQSKGLTFEIFNHGLAPTLEVDSSQVELRLNTSVSKKYFFGNCGNFDFEFS